MGFSEWSEHNGDDVAEIRNLKAALAAKDAEIARVRAATFKEAADIAFNHGCTNEGCRDCVGGNLAAIYRERALTPPGAEP